MAKFLIAYNLTMANEGGYSNTSSDLGGETYMGISRKNFPNSPIWNLINKWITDNGIPREGYIFTESEMPGITALLTSFYTMNFWMPIKGDDIINQVVANDLFDSAVNMAPHEAIIICQRSLDIQETGIMDTITLDTLNKNNNYA